MIQDRGGTADRLQQVAHGGGCTLYAAAAPAASRPVLGSLPREPAPIRLAPTLDAALEWCGSAVLDAHHSVAILPSASATLAAEFADAAAALLGAMDRVEVPAGAELMRQGERFDDLLFIVDGRATVTMQVDGAAPVRVRASGPARWWARWASCSACRGQWR